MIRFKVLLHDTWGNAKDGWHVNQSFNKGIIEVEEATPRRIIKALRDLGLVYHSRAMAPLGRAIRTTPYMGGHIDLCTRNGKPVGFLEKQD
jgi:hypothetical protein